MTRASDVKPTRRVVGNDRGEFVIEVFKRYAVIRPLRSRRGGPTEVSVAWGAIYLRELDRQALARLWAKRGRRRRR